MNYVSKPRENIFKAQALPRRKSPPAHETAAWRGFLMADVNGDKFTDGSAVALQNGQKRQVMIITVYCKLKC